MAISVSGRRAIGSLCLILLPLCWGKVSSAAPPLHVYGALPGFEFTALSPSGDKVAVIGLAEGKRRLIVLDKDNKPLFTAPVGEAKVRTLFWGGEDNVLLRVSDTVTLGPGFTRNRTELSTVLVFPLNGGQPWEILKGKVRTTGGVQGYYGSVQRGDRWIGYFGAMTFDTSGSRISTLSTTAPDLYEVDLTNGSTSKVAKRTETFRGRRNWVLDAGGNIAATFDFIPETAAWRIRDGADAVVASGKEPLGQIGLVSLGRTPGTLIYRTEDPATGDDRWFEVGGGKSEEILRDKAVMNVLIDDRSRQLIGYVENGEVPTEHFFDVRRNKVIAAARKAFPDLVVQLVEWNAAFDRLIVRTDGAGDPGSWWLVDVRTGDATRIGTAYPLKSADVGPVRTIRYRAADGLPIAGILTLPPGREAKGLPVVVLPHGGPSARDTPTFDWWAQALASRGYAVFQPNFRGSTGYGPAFELAGHGEWGRKMQTDISDGLTELARQGLVDPKRACIMGASYGGYAALAGVTLQQGLYRCAVSVAGVSDVAELVRTGERTSAYNPVMQRALKREIGTGRDLKLVSPVNFADRADAPILLIHGKDDIVVLYEQSKDMAAALRKAGKPVELIALADEDHWLSRSATRLAMLEAAVAFVEKHNPSGSPKQ